MTFFKKLFKKKPVRPRLPKGWTETKISDTEYVTHIPKEQWEKWNFERRKKDKVEELVNKDGFHLKSHGRDGMMYYVNQGRACEFYFEISGVSHYDLLFSFTALKEWFYPDNTSISEADKIKIEKEFLTWLTTKKIRGSLY